MKSYESCMQRDLRTHKEIILRFCSIKSTKSDLNLSTNSNDLFLYGSGDLIFL